MSKVIGVLVFATLLAFTYGSIVLPPACTSGGGSSVSILVYVTNLTLVATELTQIQPYNLTIGATYNVTFTFLPTSTVPVQYFNVTGVLDIGGVPTEVVIASTAVGPYTETTVATALSFCPLSLVLALTLKCAVPSLLALSLLELISCAGDNLANQFLSLIPPQGSATVQMTVPVEAEGNATFIGKVGDGSGNVIACRQGLVTLINP